MNWRKVLVLVLSLTLLLQVQYFGLDDCQKCSFGANRTSMKDFFMDYTKRCLTIDQTLSIPTNLTIMDSPKVVIE